MALKTPARPKQEKRRLLSAPGTVGKPSGNGHIIPGAFLQNLLSPALMHDERTIVQHIREGRFQRSLSLITAFSSLLGGRRGTVTHPPVRKDLSPPETWGKGVPRIKYGARRRAVR
jgi:hypothetical protein